MILKMLACFKSSVFFKPFFCFQDHTLFRRKRFIMVFNYCSFGLAVYFFFRHNSYCEPGGILFNLLTMKMYYAIVLLNYYNYVTS